jgi:hypothetical protein
MKRRQALQSILGLPALGALPRPGAAMAPPAALRQIDEFPKLATSVGDAVADGTPAYFSPPEFAALEKLSELLVPPAGNLPGAKQTQAARFLDFLISQSPADRQALYCDGLDALQAEAHRRYGTAFEALETEQAGAILAPLKEPWTYHGPEDRFARFLRAAKDDVLQATFTSREFIAANSSRGRRARGTGTYWFHLD